MNVTHRARSLIARSLILALVAACGGVLSARAAQAPTEDAPAAATASATPRTVPSPATPVPRAPRPYAKQAVIDRDFPDPDVLRLGSRSYAYATNSGGVNVQTARSRDLVAWEILGDAMPVLPPWARAGRTWAPDVSRAPQGLVMYFTAWHAASGRECIGAATATLPEGPFTPLASPLVCPLEQGGAIDPSSFVDADGARYLLWKNDGNCCAITTRVYIQRTAADGLSLTGAPVALIASDRAWEGGVVEAPVLWREGGRYHLFYSANGYAGAGYLIGHAVASSPTGPFRKDEAPWLAGGPGLVGPGGQDVASGPDGGTWLVFHSWSAKGHYREVDLCRLGWNGDLPVASCPVAGAPTAP